MYAVIFVAKLNQTDETYERLVHELRKRGEKMGCIKVISVSNGKEEITISFWRNLEDIRKWKNDYLHVKAQAQSKKWYKSFEIYETEVLSGKP